MTISVVVPAHNEERVIAANLHRLLADAQPGEFDIVVVCNGCTDRTADAARAVPNVRVAELAEAGKPAALAYGDTLAVEFPRLYLDADIALDAASARLLAAAVSEPGVHAAAPSRRFTLDRSPLLVRAYYSVWELLPGVRDGLFGRGAIAVSAEGHERICSLPAARSDDLAAHLAFVPAERRVVSGAAAVINPPRTTADLFRRRVRALQGTTELAGAEAARTSWADVAAVVRARPAELVALPVFLAFAVGAKLAVRWGRFDRGVWLRDESSRALS